MKNIFLKMANFFSPYTLLPREYLVFALHDINPRLSEQLSLTSDINGILCFINPKQNFSFFTPPTNPTEIDNLLNKNVWHYEVQETSHTKGSLPFSRYFLSQLPSFVMYNSPGGKIAIMPLCENESNGLFSNRKKTFGLYIDDVNFFNSHIQRFVPLFSFKNILSANQKKKIQTDNLNRIYNDYLKKISIGHKIESLYFNKAFVVSNTYKFHNSSHSKALISIKELLPHILIKDLLITQQISLNLNNPLIPTKINKI